MTAALRNQRLEGWEARLASVIELAFSRPYVLGRHDCFRVACAAIDALTGVDLWPQWAGRYSTKEEALALMAEFGSFDKAFDHVFGVPHVAAREARPGDIVKFVDPAGEAHLGVYLDPGAVVLDEHGLRLVPLSACTACWRIG